jgi:hypothetical protein
MTEFDRIGAGGEYGIVEVRWVLALDMAGI